MVFNNSASLRLQTLYLVAAFLETEGLTSTLSTLRKEAESEFEDLETEILPHTKPLLALVEESNATEFQNKLLALNAGDRLEGLHDDTYSDNGESEYEDEDEDNDGSVGLDVNDFASYDEYKSKLLRLQSRKGSDGDNSDNPLTNYRRVDLPGDADLPVTSSQNDESSGVVHRKHGSELQKELEDVSGNTTKALAEGIPMVSEIVRRKGEAATHNGVIIPGGEGNIISVKIINSNEPSVKQATLLSTTSKKIEYLETLIVKGEVKECYKSTTVYTTSAIALDIDHFHDWIAMTCMDGSLHVGKLDQSAHPPVLIESTISTFKDHSKYATRVRFSPDGKYLITGSYDKTINIYRCDLDGISKESDHQTGPQTLSLERIHSIDFKGEVESMCVTTVKIDKDDDTTIDTPYLIVGTRNDINLHYIELNVESEFKDKQINMNENNDTWVSFAPMDLIILDRNNYKLSGDGRTKRRLANNNKKYLACYTDSKAGRIIIFELGTNKHIREVYGVSVDGLSNPRLATDIHGKFVFATSEDNSVYAFDSRSGKLLNKLRGHSSVIRDLDYGTQGSKNCLITGSFDGDVRTWTY